MVFLSSTLQTRTGRVVSAVLLEELVEAEKKLWALFRTGDASKERRNADIGNLCSGVACIMLCFSISN